MIVHGITTHLVIMAKATFAQALGVMFTLEWLFLYPCLSAVTPCLESVPANQAGRVSTVMRHALLDSMGKPANRSAAAKMGLTVTVWLEGAPVHQDSKWVTWVLEAGKVECDVKHINTMFYMTTIKCSEYAHIIPINEENREKSSKRDITNHELWKITGKAGKVINVSLIFNIRLNREVWCIVIIP
jgi:hypothetical protein